MGMGRRRSIVSAIFLMLVLSVLGFYLPPEVNGCGNYGHPCGTPPGYTWSCRRIVHTLIKQTANVILHPKEEREAVRIMPKIIDVLLNIHTFTAAPIPATRHHVVGEETLTIHITLMGNAGIRRVLILIIHIIEMVNAGINSCILACREIFLQLKNPLITSLSPEL
jgi:hypothetical protein